MAVKEEKTVEEEKGKNMYKQEKVNLLFFVNIRIVQMQSLHKKRLFPCALRMK
jgi:hypothetical protein